MTAAFRMFPTSTGTNASCEPSSTSRPLSFADEVFSRKLVASIERSLAGEPVPSRGRSEDGQGIGGSIAATTTGSRSATIRGEFRLLLFSI